MEQDGWKFMEMCVIPRHCSWYLLQHTLLKIFFTFTFLILLCHYKSMCSNNERICLLSMNTKLMYIKLQTQQDSKVERHRSYSKMWHWKEFKNLRRNWRSKEEQSKNSYKWGQFFYDHFEDPHTELLTT